MWVALINFVATLAVVLALMMLALALISVAVLVVLGIIFYGTGRLERAGARQNTETSVTPAKRPTSPRPAVRPVGAPAANHGRRGYGVVLAGVRRFTPASAPRGGTPRRGPVRRRRSAEPSPR